MFGVNYFGQALFGEGNTELGTAPPPVAEPGAPPAGGGGVVGYGGPFSTDLPFSRARFFKPKPESIRQEPAPKARPIQMPPIRPNIDAASEITQLLQGTQSARLQQDTQDEEDLMAVLAMSDIWDEPQRMRPVLMPRQQPAARSARPASTKAGPGRMIGAGGRAPVHKGRGAHNPEKLLTRE